MLTKICLKILLIGFITLTPLVSSQYYYYEPHYAEDDLRGDYCRTRSPLRCCPQRDDACSVPILGTVCYCDMFCNRTNSADCCPDFKSVCLGIVPPPAQLIRPRKLIFLYVISYFFQLENIGIFILLFTERENFDEK